MAMVDLPGVVASLHWNGYWKRSGVPIGPSFGRKVHTNGLPLIRIQNSHRPVGLQAGMPMETADLAVPLHVHTARGIDFLPIETNHARLFSHGNLLSVKNVSILHIFKSTAQLVQWTDLFENFTTNVS